MSQPLLDVHPVSFRVHFLGSSRYQIITTVLDYVVYHTPLKREEILDTVKSAGLTSTVEDEIRAVCRELLASGDECPSAVHQRLTSVLVSRSSPAPVPSRSGSRSPLAFTLVVAINPEGAADRLWGSVASRLHRFDISADGTPGVTTMVPPRRSRRLSIMPEPAATESAPSAGSTTGRARTAGRGSRIGRPVSPARRPASPTRAAASRPAAKRGRGAGGSGGSPSSVGSRVGRHSLAAKKKQTSPAATVRTTSTTTTTTSRRSIAVRGSRRSVAAVSPPAAAVAARKQTTARRSKAASPQPRKSSLSPAKRRIERGERGARSPSFAREVRVRTLRGASDEKMDFSVPDGLTGSKILDEIMSNPRVVLETPGLLKRFSKKLKESTPKPKSVVKTSARSARSSSKDEEAEITIIKEISSDKADDAKPRRRSASRSPPPKKAKDSPAKSTAKRGRGRPSNAEKRSRTESRSPSATPPKKTRVTSGDPDPSETTDPDWSSPAVSEKRGRGRPSLASVRKSLNASLIAVPRAASSPASPVLRIHTPAASAVKSVKRSVVSVKSRSVTESAEMRSVTAGERSPRRSVAAPPAPAPTLDSPERAAGVKAMLAARSSIRRRPSGQPPPQDSPSASPNLKPAREAAAAALSRAYTALARSEAKQKELFRSRVSEVAVAASPAITRPAEKSTARPASVSRTVDEASQKITSSVDAVDSQVAKQIVSEEPPARPVSNKPSPAKEVAPESPAPAPAPARDMSEAVFASPAPGGGTPRGQLAPRSSVRRAPASALRRVLDRAPDSAARSSVRRSLRRPSPPPAQMIRPDMAAGGDSPLLDAPLTRSRRAKLAAAVEGVTETNHVNNSAKQPQPTLLDDRAAGKEAPARRGTLRTGCLMLLLLIVVVVAVLWLGRAQLPAEHRQQLEQLQLAVQRQGRQLERLVQQQLQAARGWLGQLPAIPAAPAAAGGQ